MRMVPIVVGIFAMSAAFAAPTAPSVTPKAVSISNIPGATSLVAFQTDGKLAYLPYSPQGDTLPDFSTCGYEQGGVALPNVAAKITLMPDPKGGDDRPRIQAAIDQLAKLPVDAKTHFRGAILLKAGTYKLGGSLNINASGIVLRGEGDSEKGTVLLDTLNKQNDLIRISGKAGARIAENTKQKLVDAYVPCGTKTIRVENAGAFKVGDTVFVVRESTAEWIHFIKMDQIGTAGATKAGTRQWKPGEYNINMDRIVMGVDAAKNLIMLDAPIVNPIQQEFGGGYVVKFDYPGRIDHVGVEFLRGDSVFAGKTDEEHGWNFIDVAAAQNVFVRNITARHFGYAAATLRNDAKWCTVQDSQYIEPISQITGGRRYSFGIQGGTLSLIQRCYGHDGRHDYVLGAHTEGPNVFLHCKADSTHADTGPHHRWSCGVLFDDVQVQGDMDVEDRQASGSGHGWAGAQMIFWNCSAANIRCQEPPTAQNFCIGCTTKSIAKGHWAQHPNGWIESLNAKVQPLSLYEAQLKERLGPQALVNIGPTTQAPK